MLDSEALGQAAPCWTCPVSFELGKAIVPLMLKGGKEASLVVMEVAGTI
jgi:hypothetical protein